MEINKKLAEELNIKVSQVDATVKLIDEGNTIPFIARYRKEVTGSLNDEVLRNLHERLLYLRNLEEKKEQVLSVIEEQGKLTPELKEQILSAETLVVVEDLYRPYRPKRRTRATIAKEKGLEPLADLIFLQKLDQPALEAAAGFISEEKEVLTAEEALHGAKDIIAERVSDEADYRIYIRNLTMEEGKVVSMAKDEKQQSVYELYYDFEEPIKKIAGHRILAINRGEAEKFLTIHIEAPEERILRYLEKKLIFGEHSEIEGTDSGKENEYAAPILREVAEDSYHRLIAPAIEREIRSSLTEQAEDGAIRVFGKNLEQLLMQPPIANQVVLGWDPAFRTGCKIAVVDATGKVLETTVVYPTEPQNKIEATKKTVRALIDKYHITLFSVGNGTASRESEQIIVDMLKEWKLPISYVITNEAGASVYSASKLATEEFPNFDVGARSAASIARRVQDPLAELVKIEPRSIGVGQYQHDMNQKKLGESLGSVVEDCVNKVGVDLNTASAPLLEYVSGISKAVAKNIVAYREENGSFKSRKELLKVAKLGPKAFEQCAGFLRIRNAKNPLDGTGVHPESYQAAELLLEKLGMSMEDIKKYWQEQGRSKGASKAKKPPRKEKKEKKVTIRNTNSVMGQALLKAMGGATIQTEKEEPAPVTEVPTGGIAAKVRDKKKMAEELGIGVETLIDILKEFEKPGRDPREDMPKPILRTDVLDMKDLKPGMILKGTVRNVIDFGAFVDIGVHQDGLVHISEMTNRYIKHPLEVVSVGDIVEVRVLDVDLQKKRIQLSMKPEQEKKKS